MTEIIRMNCANGEGLELKKYDDVIWPISAPDPEQWTKKAGEFHYKNTDILCCSYPKTGTHWIANILWGLKTQDFSNRPRDEIIEFGIFTPGYFDKLDDPRLIFTHQKPKRIVPPIMENKGKIVLMLRNPKDDLTSYYFFMKNAKLLKNRQTWDEFFQSYVQGEIMFGSYFDYIKEWEQTLKEVSEGSINLQIEVFYYEELVREPKKNLIRLNNFLGFQRDDQYLERVLEDTSMDELRKYYNKKSDKLQHELTTDEEGNTVIFRKGKIGDWKNHMTVAQSEIIDKALKEALRHGIINFTFEP